MTALLEDQTPADPFELFASWFEEACGDKAIKLPEAMHLATVDTEGYPDGRIVLLKGHGPEGFVFYTNMRSAKGRALRTHPRGALTFYWPRLDRQVRVVGDVEQVPEAEADAYFKTRPRGSQLSAWASDQSEVADSRAALESRMAEAETRFSGKDVPRPPHWSGYRVRPLRIEFWQNQDNRLHDRLRYQLENGQWLKQRLFP